MKYLRCGVSFRGKQYTSQSAYTIQQITNSWNMMGGDYFDIWIVFVNLYHDGTNLYGGICPCINFANGYAYQRATFKLRIKCLQDDPNSMPRLGIETLVATPDSFNLRHVINDSIANRYKFLDIVDSRSGSSLGLEDVPWKQAYSWSAGGIIRRLPYSYDYIKFINPTWSRDFSINPAGTWPHSFGDTEYYRLYEDILDSINLGDVLSFENTLTKYTGDVPDTGYHNGTKMFPSSSSYNLWAGPIPATSSNRHMNGILSLIAGSSTNGEPLPDWARSNRPAWIIPYKQPSISDDAEYCNQSDFIHPWLGKYYSENGRRWASLWLMGWSGLSISNASTYTQNASIQSSASYNHRMLPTLTAFNYDDLPQLATDIIARWPLASNNSLFPLNCAGDIGSTLVGHIYSAGTHTYQDIRETWFDDHYGSPNYREFLGSGGIRIRTMEYTGSGTAPKTNTNTPSNNDPQIDCMMIPSLISDWPALDVYGMNNGGGRYAHKYSTRSRIDDSGRGEVEIFSTNGM